MNNQPLRTAQFTRFACGCALFLSAIFSAVFFFYGLFVTWYVHGNKEVLEIVDAVRLPAPLLLFATIGFLLLLSGILYSLWRLRPPHLLTALLWVLWFFLSAAFLVANGLQQVLDYQTVLEASERLAAGSYSVLDQPYFHALSHQIPMLLPMEIFARLFPRLPMNRAMQLLNLVTSLICGFCLSLIGGILFSKETRGAVRLLFFFSLPTVLYCTYVYGTIFMMVIDLTGTLFFLLYEQNKRNGQSTCRFLSISAGVLIGLACMMKYNGIIFVIAFMIISVLSALAKKNVCVLLPAVLSVVVCFGSTVGVIHLYECRAGIQMEDSISMKARFVMGLQEGPASGWYNNYITQFISREVTREEELEKANADFQERLQYFFEKPAYAISFFGEKLFSQWLDPTYGTIRYGQIAPRSCKYAMVSALYDESSPWYRIIYGYMKLYQSSLYLLGALGLWFSMKNCNRDGTGIALLPVAFLGGMLYHLLFEAKSAYAWPYVVYLLPYAGYGLVSLLSFCVSWMKLKKSGNRGI